MKKNMLVLLCTVFLLPVVLKAQQNNMNSLKVEFSARGISLKEAFAKLEQLSGFNINYNTVALDDRKIVDLPKASRTLGQTLELLLRGTSSSFRQVGKNIVIKPAAKTGRQGKLSGKVIDEGGQGLPGATIRVLETGGSVQAGNDGGYVLSLTEGIYTLEISYVSFQARRVTGVDITAEQPAYLNVVLKNDSKGLKEVVITSSFKQASVEGLYARQKNTAGITDGISAEQIARTPDKNIGEVLKWVSGLATMENKYVVVRGLSERYNQSQLNGQVMPSTELNRKNFSFDIIPANIVENVVVSKTITPDQSAEFGGGLVQVTTMSIPTENFLNFSAGLSFNDKTTGKDFLSQQLEGKEYFGSVSSHRDFAGKLKWNDATEALDAFKGKEKDPNVLSNNWGVYKFKAQPSQNYQFSVGHVFPAFKGSQFGVVASLSYRNTLSAQDIRMSRNYEQGGGFIDSAGNFFGFIGKRYSLTTNIGALVGVGYKDQRNQVSFQSVYLRNLDQPLLIGMYRQRDLGYYDLTTQTTMLTNQLKGEHAIGKKGIKFKWMGSYLTLDREKPDNHVLQTEALPDENQPNNYNILTAAANQSQYGALRTWNRAFEKDVNWDASLAVPFDFHTKTPITNTLKVGYAGWSKDRLFYVLNVGTLFANPNSNYIPLGEAFSPANGVTFQASRYGDNSHKTAALQAPYLMLDDRFGKFRLVWGLRAEYYNLNKVNGALEKQFEYINRDKPSQEQYDFSLLKNMEPNWRYFPSANLTYSLTPSMNLRLGFAKSIIRPDLRELNYFEEYDFELGGLYRANYVRSTMINNYDFRYEWYPSPGEILSVSLFRKDLAYPMEITKDKDQSTYILSNSKSARNVGVEVELRKSLAFTDLTVLKNITLYGNATILDAHVKPLTTDYNGIDTLHPLKVIPREFVGASQHRPQQGASNYMVNVGMYYDTRQFSLSMAYNSVGNRMFRPNVDYSQSLFERPLKALDAQVAFRFLGNHAEVKLNVSNLLNSYQVVYYNIYDNQGTNTKENPSTKELGYQPGHDNIDYESRPGRTYSATLSYKF